jgi:chromosome segregation ATPase
MLWMITKFIFCLLAAGALGFIVGWVLSSLIKNEKLEEQYSQIKDDFETKRAELNQAYSDLDAKEHELLVAENNIQQLQKELLTKNMDLEEYQKHGILSQDTSALELENNSLKEEISEYKYLENENELLHNELKELSIEKEKLLQEIEKYHQNPLETEEKRAIDHIILKDNHIKVLQKDLKSAKKKIARMDKYLKKIIRTKSKKDEKSSKQEEEIDTTPVIFDFNQKPDQPQ